jgi:hypothetical protein
MRKRKAVADSCRKLQGKGWGRKLDILINQSSVRGSCAEILDKGAGRRETDLLIS